MSLTERTVGEGVLLLSLDRPPVNAMDLGLLNELNTRLERLARDPPSALVIAGRDNVFSAGVDLKPVPSYGEEERRSMGSGLNRMVIGTYGSPRPVVGASTG